MKMDSTVYLIPSLLSEDATETIPPYVLNAVKNCQAFFVENERTARRFLKKLSKEIFIDGYDWFTMDKHSKEAAGQRENFIQKIKEGKNIGILSEAGCHGIADPGQELII